MYSFLAFIALCYLIFKIYKCVSLPTQYKKAYVNLMIEKGEREVGP